MGLKCKIHKCSLTVCLHSTKHHQTNNNSTSLTSNFLTKIMQKKMAFNVYGYSWFIFCIILICIKGFREGRKSLPSWGKMYNSSWCNASVLQLTSVLTLCISQSLAGVSALPPGGGIWTHTPTWGDSGFLAWQTEGSFLLTDEEDACPLGRGHCMTDCRKSQAKDVLLIQEWTDSHPASVQLLGGGAILGQQPWQVHVQVRREWQRKEGEWMSKGSSNFFMRHRHMRTNMFSSGKLILPNS